MAHLPRTVGVLKHESVTHKLLETLEKGVYQPGGFLPPERVLAAEFAVSRPTLRKALAQLVAAGVLTRHPGIGTRLASAGRDSRENGGRWRIIGLLLPDITNRFFIEVTEAIEYTALQRGYQLLLCNSRHQPALEEVHVRRLAELQVDGVILAHDPNQPAPGSVSLLRRAGIPFVFLFSSPAEEPCDSVVLDEQAGVNQVMRYLFSLGHRQIAFCRPLPGAAPHPREEGYVQFMVQAGCPVNPRFVIPYESLDDASCRLTLAELFGCSPRPTALFAGNDHIALILLKHLASMQVNVPQEVSVVGFGNLRFTEHLPVPLTTVDQPKHEMGRRALELLLERIQLGGSQEPRTEVFQPHLIIRDSCGIAPAADRVPALQPA